MRAAHAFRPAGFARALIFVVCVGAGAGPAGAFTDSGEYGGPGGAPFRSECAPWSHVTGFAGRIGAWLISIEPICAPLLAEEQKLGQPVPNGQRYGGNSGGNSFAVSCPVGYAVGAWVFDMVVNSDMKPTYVNAIGMECRLIAAPNETYRAQIGDDLGATLTKDVAVIAQMGWPRPTYTHQCPPGELAMGVRGRAGIYIDALGLICNRPPTAQEAALCNTYRDTAVAAVAENQKLQCGHSGDRWNPDPGAHMNWCIALGASRSASTQAEAAARTGALEDCKLARMGIQKNVGTGAILQQPGITALPQLKTGAITAAPGSNVEIQNAPASTTAVKTVKALGKAKPPANYAGAWHSWSDKNWTYEITLAQQGNTVSGTYVAQNGSVGRINGTVDGNVLSFNWDQDGGYTGTAQFVLAADGNSFTGTYRGDPNPALTADLLTGTWNGTLR